MSKIKQRKDIKKSAMPFVLLILVLATLASSPVSIAAKASCDSSTKNNETIPLTTDEAFKSLQNLSHYEIDHSYLLSQAIDNLKNENLKHKLLEFKHETEHNIVDLASLIKKLKREPPVYSKDFKGFFMQGYAAMRGLAGEIGVLKALRTNQFIIVRAYEKALKLRYPQEMQSKIKSLYSQNIVQLKYIDTKIKELG